MKINLIKLNSSQKLRRFGLAFLASASMLSTEIIATMPQPATALSWSDLAGPAAREAFGAARRFYSEHQRVPPFDDRNFLIPAHNFGGSRISVNFDHRSWVPRGSRPVPVEFSIHGPENVVEMARQSMRVHLKADKRAKKDRNRGPGILQHGDRFNLAYGTSGDRAYYFVERPGGITGENLPEGVYFQITRLD